MQFMTSTGSNRAQGLLCYSQKVPLCPTMPPPGGSFVFQLLDVVPNKSVKIILHETQHTIRSLLFVVFLSLSLSLSVTMMFFRSFVLFFLSFCLSFLLPHRVISLLHFCHRDILFNLKDHKCLCPLGLKSLH